MGKTAIVWTCAHADPAVSNERFDWLGSLIEDIKPDYVVDLGDGADMQSLSSHDTKYPKVVAAQSYERDIDSYNEAMDRLWGRYKISKRKRPFRIGFAGNHEARIQKALAYDPRIEGARYGISPKHLQTDHWFDEYHDYENGAPAIAEYDGVYYSHFFQTGNSGAAMSGLHHAYGLLTKRTSSATCGHSHKRSLFFKDDAVPNPLIGLVAGCFKGADESWAGQSNRDWWKGVVIKRNIQNGWYDPEFVSMERLKQAYG